MYKKILVPHAGTQAGNKAVLHAKNMAKVHGAKLTILHIVEKIPSPSMTFSHDRAELKKDIEIARREFRKEMDDKMQKIANDLKKENISAHVKVIEGYPDEEIIRIANGCNYDLVIMAKRRKLPGLKAILKLGSVSRKVLEKINCPVMLIDGDKK